MPLCFGLILGAVGCSAALSRAPVVESCTECVEARRVNGYCDSCDHGHVAGRVIPSRELHEAIDAHGHEIDPASMVCLECAEAIERDGYCTRCRFGFVEGQLYFTELTWSLHRGKTRLAEEVECSGCLAVHGGAGICELCGTGWVGNVSFTDLAMQARAARQFQRLELAVERLESCEMCAIGGFFGRSCPKCGTPAIPDPPPGGETPGRQADQ